MKEVKPFFFCQRWCTTQRFCTGVFCVYVFTNKYTQHLQTSECDFCERFIAPASPTILPPPITEQQTFLSSI